MSQTPRVENTPQTSASRFNWTCCYAALCVAGLSAATPAVAQEYSMTGLGFLGSTSPFSQAYGISGDGSTVVGWSRNASNQTEAFRWTSAGMVGLGFLGSSSPYSYGHGISGDGSTVVGWSRNASGRTEAFRWTSAGMQGLGFLGGSLRYSIAYDVSGDGSTVVGHSYNASNDLEAFRWTSAGMQGLGFLDRSVYRQSLAYGVSGDGSTVVGRSYNGSNYEAFRWTSTGMQGLGFLGGSSPHSEAWDVSGDGSTVVGYSRNASGRTEAFRWTSAGMVGLGFVGGGGSSPYSLAYGISGDGSTVVGLSRNASNQNEAFRWTSATGIESLSGLLSAEGVDLTDITLQDARSVSDDGSVITGNMNNAAGRPEAYLAIYDTRVAGVIAPAAFAASVDGVSALSQGVRGQGDAGLRQMTDVARNYSLARVPEVEVTRGFGGSSGTRYGAFAVGEGLWGEDNSAGQAKTAKGTAGLLAQTSTGLRFGLGVQSAGLDRTDGYLGSSVEADGYGGVAFVAYEPQETGLRAYATAMVLELDADIDRNYLNGAAVETARGSTDGRYYGVDIEVGYAFRKNDQLSLTPLVGFEYGKAKFDGYTETGGTFAGMMSDQSSESRSARLGVAGSYQVSRVLEVTGSVAVGRVSETLTASGLAVTALSGMQFSGASGDRDYSVGYLTVGANYQLSPTMRLHGSLGGQRAFGSSASDMDAIEASVGIVMGF